MFQKLQRGLACIKEVMKLFRKREGKVKAPQGDLGEEEWGKNERPAIRTIFENFELARTVVG
jgi:hypothetical protein